MDHQPTYFELFEALSEVEYDSFDVLKMILKMQTRTSKKCVSVIEMWPSYTNIFGLVPLNIFNSFAEFKDVKFIDLLDRLALSETVNNFYMYIGGIVTWMVYNSGKNPWSKEISDKIHKIKREHGWNAISKDFYIYWTYNIKTGRRLDKYPLTNSFLASLLDCKELVTNCREGISSLHLDSTGFLDRETVLIFEFEKSAACQIEGKCAIVLKTTPSSSTAQFNIFVSEDLKDYPAGIRHTHDSFTPENLHLNLRVFNAKLGYLGGAWSNLGWDTEDGNIVSQIQELNRGVAWNYKLNLFYCGPDVIK